MADKGGRMVRRISTALPGRRADELFLPGEDGREVYCFRLGGRHLRTLDALTGAVRYRFDYDPAGGSQTLLVQYAGMTRTVARTTAESRRTTYAVTDRYDGSRQRVVVPPDQTQTLLTEAADGRDTLTVADGSRSIATLGPDPRFGMMAPLVTSLAERLPGGVTRSIAVTGAADPAGFDPAQPLRNWSEEVRINGRTQPFRLAFDAATRTLTATTPLQRQTMATVDTAGRPLTVAVAGLAAVNLTYDPRGRLSRSSRVVGARRLLASRLDPRQPGEREPRDLERQRLG